MSGGDQGLPWVVMTQVAAPARVPLRISGLTKRFGSVGAVDGVDLDLNPGELLALVGPSGCGKSTLLRSIAGLIDIDSGRVELDGQLVDDGSTRLPPERRSVGLVFQEHALFPHLDVRDNVGFGVRSGDRAQIRSRVAEMLELVNLGDQGDRFPHELSGGERQRVALARALAPAPALMLLDEPFASLDHNLRTRLRRDVTQVLRRTETPAVFVTHDQAEALAIGDRIAVMLDGRIEQLDSPEQVFHQPTNQFVASFMGDAGYLAIDTSSGAWHTALGPVAADRSLASPLAMVRPDDLRFVADAVGDAVVTALDYHGSGWTATVRLNGGPALNVTLSHLETPTVGQRGALELVEGHQQVLVESS